MALAVTPKQLPQSVLSFTDVTVTTQPLVCNNRIKMSFRLAILKLVFDSAESTVLNFAASSIGGIAAAANPETSVGGRLILND